MLVLHQAVFCSPWLDGQCPSISGGKIHVNTYIHSKKWVFAIDFSHILAL